MSQIHDDDNEPESDEIMPKVKSHVREKGPKLNKPTTLAELVSAQSQDPTCEDYAASVGHPDSKFYVESSSLFVIQPIIDGSIQIVVLKLSQACLLYLTNHPSLRDFPDRAEFMT